MCLPQLYFWRFSSFSSSLCFFSFFRSCPIHYQMNPQMTLPLQKSRPRTISQFSHSLHFICSPFPSLSPTRFLRCYYRAFRDHFFFCNSFPHSGAFLPSSSLFFSLSPSNQSWATLLGALPCSVLSQVSQASRLSLLFSH